MWPHLVWILFSLNVETVKINPTFTAVVNEGWYTVSGKGKVMRK